MSLNYLMKAKILIVEDDHINAKLISFILLEHETIIAQTGEDALEIAELEVPDLILLDIMLPAMDGYEVCKRLKDSAKTEHIPVIFISAKSDARDEAKGLLLGAIDYIKKPFSIPIIAARVSNHLELKRSRDILKNLSTLDGLTNIPNRRYFDDMFQREWQRAVREKTCFSLLMIDIDYFKQYNDHYGHGAGDKCLKHVVNVLHQALKRATDFLARYGGEEFVVLLHNTDSEGARIVAENLRVALELAKIRHEYSNVSKFVTISLGLGSVLPDQSISKSEFIAEVDKMLYEAKEKGRNNVQFCCL